MSSKMLRLRPSYLLWLALSLGTMVISSPALAGNTTGTTRTQTYQPGEPFTGLPGGAPGRGYGLGPSGLPSVYCQNWPGHSPYPQYPGTGPNTPCGPNFQPTPPSPPLQPPPSETTDCQVGPSGSLNRPNDTTGGLLHHANAIIDTPSDTIPELLAQARPAGSNQPCGPRMPIEIRLRAFIPSPAVALTPQDPTHQIRCFFSGMINLDDCLFRGDGRGYSYNQGTHRFIQNIVLYGQQVQPFAKFCKTHEYYPSQGFHPSGKPWWWYSLNPNAREVMSQQLQADASNNGYQVTHNANFSVVTMWFRGANPLVLGPPIDANLTVALYYQPGQPLTVVVGGAHDGFPAYELYVNGQPIIGPGLPYNPAETFGASPYSLINTVIPQVQIQAGPVQISQRYQRNPPPDPPACN
jgi:hypothetical protein